jgi:outer membrane protein with beta-barrel domain
MASFLLIAGGRRRTVDALSEETTMSRRAAVVLTLSLATLSPAASWASGLEVRLGAFFPNAKSDLFADDAVLYTPINRAGGCTAVTCPPIHQSDWIGFYGGAEFSFSMSEHVELGLSVDGYERHLDTFYSNDTRPDGSDIRQTLKLSLVPVGVSLRFLPMSRRAPISPYFTVGGDAIYYHYDEYGDFIDFFDPNRAIIPDSFHSSGWAWGGHAAVGVRIPLGHDFDLTTEGRYQFASKEQMGEDFFKSHLDVNGWAATMGFRLRF